MLVVTWTRDEMQALADVLTPGVDPSRRWYRYDRKFEEYLPSIRNGAPARFASRLGSYHPALVGKRKVLCFKSELHMNQDGVEHEDGKATLPVADLFHQIIDEVDAVARDHGRHRGRHVRRSRARRRGRDPRGEVRAHQGVPQPAVRGQDLQELVRRADGAARGRVAIDEGAPCRARGARLPARRPSATPDPTASRPSAIPGIKNDPDIKIDGRDFKAFLPMLTTDFFEFGTSANRLDKKGCGVEMGDAVLGLVAKELGAAAPDWLVIRNVSDPVINGDLPLTPHNMQTHWAVWFYEEYGYWTSVNSAIVTWAMIAG